MPGLRIFWEKQYFGLYCPLHSCKKLGRSLESFRSKVQRSKKNTIFGNLIPYNPILRIFSKEKSCSNNGPYCPLHSCKKLGRSLEPFWSKGQRTKKTHLFWTLNPLESGIKIFFRKTIWLKRCALLSTTLLQKIGKSLEPFQRKVQKLEKKLFGHLIPYYSGSGIFQKTIRLK